MELIPNLATAAPPFRLHAAPGDAFQHASWRTAREGALTALGRQQSVAVLGRAGTGKTLLLNSLAETLRAEGKRTARFGAETAGADVVLADEVNALDDAGLERLWASPAPFIAAGLPDVERRVLRCKRPVAVVRLSPLSPENVARYVVGRLVATGRPGDLFDPEAIVALARHSGGLFRLVVVLAGSAMFLADQEHSTHVTRGHVDEAAAMREVLQEEEPEAFWFAPAPPFSAAPVAAPTTPTVPVVPNLPVSDPSAPTPAADRKGTGERRKLRLAPIVGVLAGLVGLGLAIFAVARAVSYGHHPPVTRLASHTSEPARSPAAVLEKAKTEPPPAVRSGTAPIQPVPAPGRSVLANPSPDAAPQVPTHQIRRPAIPPASVSGAAATIELSFRGPIMNETMGQGGQLQLTIRSSGDSGPVVAHFHAYAGLIGTGELTGTLGAAGRLSLSGQLMMGRNPFETVLTGTIAGDTLIGNATFVRPGRGNSARSTFRLSRL